MEHRTGSGLADLGLELAVVEPWRLPQLNAVMIPEGKDDMPRDLAYWPILTLRSALA